ncbi:MAG TPA: Na(+)/glucose symporter [Firmicutes bacterium]|nr:Na(+)/glucose symporter [Bacillota bacterium]
MSLGPSAGYPLLLGFAGLLILVSVYVAKRFPLSDVDELLAAGRSVPFGLTAASVFVAWVWTTTIMGATEAGFWFGVSGGFNYGWAAAIPFFLFVPLAMRIRRLMPRCTTFVEFARERFDNRLAKVLTVYGTVLVLYVAMEQSVGIGYVFQYAFNMPYKPVAFLAGLIFASYIAIAGLRGSIYNSVLQFMLITAVMFVIVPLILSRVGTGWLYERLVDVVTNPNNPNHNPDALNWFSASGWRYGFAYIGSAVAQIFLSQGYYSTAVAAGSRRALLWAYIVGGALAWIPIPLMSGNVLGLTGLAMGLTPDKIPVTTGTSAVVMSTYMGVTGAVMFALLITMAGITTGANGLAGLQAVMTVDVYERLRPAASEGAKIRFARIITIVWGVIIGLLGMSLEGVSLLLIDIWCGILLTAPCAALILGVFWRKVSPKGALLSIPVGLAGGILAYFAVKDPNLNWVVGNLVALWLPAIFLAAWAVFERYQFDFSRLAVYEPGHRVRLQAGGPGGEEVEAEL